MTPFIIVATIIFALLALIWKKGDWFNFFLKALFFGMTLWGIVLSLQTLGYLIKA